MEVFGGAGQTLKKSPHPPFDLNQSPPVCMLCPKRRKENANHSRPNPHHLRRSRSSSQGMISKPPVLYQFPTSSNDMCTEVVSANVSAEIFRISIKVQNQRVDRAIESRKYQWGFLTSQSLKRTLARHSFSTSFKKNQNASRPSEHSPVMGKKIKTFRWDQRLQIQNLFMAFKQVPRCR